MQATKISQIHFVDAPTYKTTVQDRKKMIILKKNQGSEKEKKKKPRRKLVNISQLIYPHYVHHVTLYYEVVSLQHLRQRQTSFPIISVFAFHLSSDHLQIIYI